MRFWMILLTAIFVTNGLCMFIGVLALRFSTTSEAAERAARQQKFLDYLKDTDNA